MSSVQETYLKGIADAIREKEGSTDTIQASKFAERIASLSGRRMIKWNKAIINSSGSSKTLTSVACNGTRLVAVATNNTNIAIYADCDNPDKWYETTLPNSGYWTSVTYGNDKFVAVASNIVPGVTGGSNIAAYSSDGITWHVANLPVAKYWESVTYGNDKFVAVAENSDVGIYSLDGITWQQSVMPNAQWGGVTYGKDKFVAVSGTYGTSTIGAYSFDGVNWTQITFSSAKQRTAICYGNGRFVTAGLNTYYVDYSEDGVTWKSSSSTLPGTPTGFVYADGLFVAASYDSPCCSLSYDGITWVGCTVTNFSPRFYDVTYTNGHFVMVSSQGYVYFSEYIVPN